MLTEISVVTLFPQWFDAIGSLGLTGRALDSGRISLRLFNPRDYASGAHRSVDDRPFGGGPGMVMRPEPLAAAIEAAVAERPLPVSGLSPPGRRLDHEAVCELADRQCLVLVCGRYEGIDQRVVDSLIDEQWSIGDFVLSGGEIAAAALIDAVVRLQPGVLGHAGSAEQDSFSDGLLDWPHYTRPESWRALSVPEVLRSGDHDRIAQWRRAQSLGRTWLQRPDLLRQKQLDEGDRRLLDQFIANWRDRDA